MGFFHPSQKKIYVRELIKIVVRKIGSYFGSALKGNERILWPGIIKPSVKKGPKQKSIDGRDLTLNYGMKIKPPLKLFR